MAKVRAKRLDYIGFRLGEGDKDIKEAVAPFINTTARIKELLRLGIAAKELPAAKPSSEWHKQPLVWNSFPGEKEKPKAERSNVAANILGSLDDWG